ncbi:MAG TPA: hypothetical protein VN661_03800 [Candidatus Acidoferrales bacterium]|nr:hypothetical protein [Candidatus Acidoferrales bacterium]
MFAKEKPNRADAGRVRDDWFANLPGEKTRVFEAIVQQWECTYAMMSVSLDEAIALRIGGQLVCARQQLSIAADLFDRLAGALMRACDVLAHRAERARDLPAVEPLHTRFFRGDTAQSAASWNEILHHVLFGNRLRFFHKLRILAGTVRKLNDQFSEAAGDIREGLSTKPSQSWGTLDSLHYDLNTCLRESEIVLKSYLRALPSDHVSALAEALDAAPALKRVRPEPTLSRAPA